jgi:hypothetical protein
MQRCARSERNGGVGVEKCRGQKKPLDRKSLI